MNKIINIVYINFAYFVKLLTPLILVPIIKIKYTNEELGAYLYALASAGWLVLIIEFGFGYYGAKRIAKVKSTILEKELEGRIFIAKLILAIIIAFPAIIILNLTEVISQKKEWGVIAILYALGLALYPNYRIMYKNESSKLLVSEAIFVIVLAVILYLDDTEQNFNYVGFGMCSIRLFMAFFESRIAIISIAKTKNIFKSSLNTIIECKESFFFNMALALYTTLPVILCGFVIKDLDKLNAILIADRVVKSVMGVLGQLGAYIYTQLVKLSNDNFWGKWRMFMYSIEALALLSFVILYYEGEVILKLLKQDNQNTRSQVQVMSFIPVIAMANYMLAINYLIIKGLQKNANLALTTTGIIAVTITIPMTNIFGITGPAITWIIAESMLLLMLVIMVWLKVKKA